MKILRLGKKRLFGLKRRLGLLRNDMDIEPVAAGLQPRDGACTRRQRQKQPVAAPPMEGGLQTSGMTAHIALQHRLSSTKNKQKKPPNLPHLGMTGEGWGFLRPKDRGGQKKAHHL